MRKGHEFEHGNGDGDGVNLLEKAGGELAERDFGGFLTDLM